MKLHISDKHTVGSIQEKFHHYFPKLRLEFFDRGHKAGEASSSTHLVASELPLSEIRQMHNQGYIELSPYMKVHDLEQQLEREYGLHAQVFRRSRGVWLQTTTSDEKTLEEQSHMSMPMIPG